MALSANGLVLTLLVGPGLPFPAPPTLMESLLGVEVTHRDDGPSGFQVSFMLSRGSLLDALDYTTLLGPLLKPWSRVIIIATVNGIPAVLMDGMITHRQHRPDTEPGDAMVTITGEDVSVMMDLEEKRVLHPALPDMAIVARIFAQYVRYGLRPVILPPLVSDAPVPAIRVPTQQGTDREMLHTLAERNGFVFYVSPGPLPMVNTAYWGPPNRLDAPQPALAIGLGRNSNVDKLEFAYDALAGATVADTVQDSLTGARLPVETFLGLRVPPFVAYPGVSPLQTSRTLLSDTSSGADIVAALGRGQARTDASTDGVVTAIGELDVLRYGRPLAARGTVGVRGAGWTHDGLYYVKQVTHRIGPEGYRQAFVLTREGEGSLVPAVVP